MNLRMLGVITEQLLGISKEQVMGSSVRFGIKFFPKSEQVIKVLEVVPKGARSLFIEQAVLNFAKRSPSINFHFEGITQPKRKRRSKDEMANDENIKSKSGEAQPHPYKPKTNENSSVEGNKMMFDFNKMG